MEPDAERQYTTTRKLAARGSLHDRYAPTSWFAWAAERLPLSVGDHVLDVGCGPAWFWRASLDRLPEGLHLTLTDASSAMVEAARSRDLPIGNGSVIVEQMDTAALPYPDERFDCVVAMHMLYHVAEPATVCADLARVLRPGGRIAITTNTPDNFRTLGAIGAQSFGGSSDDLGASLFSLDDAEHILDETFKDVVRHELIDTYRITDATDVEAFLLSMPPGDEAGPDAVEKMRALVAEAMMRGKGEIVTTRRTGMVTACKPA